MSSVDGPLEIPGVLRNEASVRCIYVDPSEFTVLQVEKGDIRPISLEI